MVWNKVKKQLEDFLTPSLDGVVGYRASGYKYRADRSGNCYITVHKKDVLSLNTSDEIRWYETEQDVKNDGKIILHITSEEVEVVRTKSGGKIPEERLAIIAKDHKMSECAKTFISAQNTLFKSDFQKVANTFLTTSIDQCLDSEDIMLNILAILDRRVGKNRLKKMKPYFDMKHPAVKYFYDLRVHNPS